MPDLPTSTLQSLLTSLSDRAAASPGTAFSLLPRPSSSSSSSSSFPNPSWPPPLPPPSSPDEAPRIVVLDSSFNPPTLAHFALAQSPSSSSSSVRPSTLLLWSIRNPDKDIRAADPEILDRIQLLAKTAEAAGTHAAAALIDAPLFVMKSEILACELPRLFGVERVQLEFRLGEDTLVRFADPKYYTDFASSMRAFFERDNSTLAVARRASANSPVADGDLLPESLRPWADRVTWLQIDAGLAEASSTAVRRYAREGREDVVQSLCLPQVAEYVLRRGMYREGA